MAPATNLIRVVIDAMAASRRSEFGQGMVGSWLPGSA